MRWAKRTSSVKQPLRKSYVIFQGSDRSVVPRPGRPVPRHPLSRNGVADPITATSESESARAAHCPTATRPSTCGRSLSASPGCAASPIASKSCHRPVAPTTPKRAYLHERSRGQFGRYTGIDSRFHHSRARMPYSKDQPWIFPVLSGMPFAIRSQRQKRILKATFRYNQSNQTHYAESQLVHQLCNAAWVPQRDS